MSILVTAQAVRRTGSGHLLVQASEIGIRPGHCPKALPSFLGDGSPFVLISAARSADGELLCALYQQAGGQTLKVFNG